MTTRKGIRVQNSKQAIGAPVGTPTPTPTPVPTPGSISETYYNGSGSNSALTTPYVQGYFKAAPGDFPINTQPSYFTPGGTAIPSQAMHKGKTWSDGSWRFFALAMRCPDSFAAPGASGDRHSYTVKPVADNGGNTPGFTLAAFLTANDIVVTLRTDLTNLANDAGNFYFSVRECVALGIVEGVDTGAGYPLGCYRLSANGAITLKLKAKGYLRRKSDGAYHTMAQAEVFITTCGAIDKPRVTVRLGQPAQIATGARGAQQTVGGILAKDITDVFGIAEVSNNGTTYYTFGGPTDWRRVTLPANPVNITTNYITFTSVPNDANRPRGVLGYVFESTGALPTGIQAHTAYWAWPDAAVQKARLYCQRGFISWHPPPGTNYTLVRLWTPNTLIAYPWANNYQNATVTGRSAPLGPSDDPQTVQLWYNYEGGTTGTTPPVAHLNDEIIDGSVKWTPVNAVMTDQGSGTISAWPVVTLPVGAWEDLLDHVTVQELWLAPGVSPELECIKDTRYLMDKAKAFPPFELGITPLFNNYITRGFDGYSVGEPTIRGNLNDFGDDPGDPRIGWLNSANALALIMQDDLRVQRFCRAQAAGWQDRPNTTEDPRSLTWMCGVTGLNNIAGVPVPGMGPLLPTFNMSWNGGFFTNPGQPLGPGKYNTFYGPTNATVMESSHMPACWIWPLMTSGNEAWIDAAMDLMNASLFGSLTNTVINVTPFNFLQSGVRTITFPGNPRQYACLQLIGAQQRSMAWACRALFMCDDVLPLTHPARAYVDTVVHDAMDASQAAKAWMQANAPETDALGVGFWMYTNWAVQLWELSYKTISFAHAGGQDLYPQMRTIAEDTARFLYAICDDGNGGNSGLIEFNFARWNVVTAVPPAGTQIPLHLDYDSTIVQAKGPFPPDLLYTAPNGLTDLASFAQSLVTFINGQTAWTSLGYYAVYDYGAVFRIRQPNAFFGGAGDCVARLDKTFVGGVLYFYAGQNGFVIYKPVENNQRIQGYFADVREAIDWNLGVGWPQGNTTDFVLYGTSPLYDGTNGWWPYSSTAYGTAGRCAINTCAQFGIANVNPGGSTGTTIALAMNNRFRSAHNGPPHFTGGVAQSWWNGAATVNNFAIRSFADQDAHPYPG